MAREFVDRADLRRRILGDEPEFELDDRAQLDQTREIIERLRSIGATAVNLRFRHRSLDHFLELLERFASEVMEGDT